MLRAHRSPTRASRGFALIDLLLGVTALVFLATFTLAQVARTREDADRTTCASNLRRIGQELMLYSNDYRGAYPRTIAEAGADANSKPVWGTPYEQDKELGPGTEKEPADAFLKDDKPGAKFKPQPNDVTAALYLLLRTQDITPSEFICPSTRTTRWDYGGGMNTSFNWSNWKGNAGIRDHLSYSYQNPYPSKDAIAKGFKFNNSIAAEFAVASDMNPGDPELCKLTINSRPEQLRSGNSLNHRREGQNVLFGDGHVAFESTPFVGVKQDNIFTYGQSGSDRPDRGGDDIVGSPSAAGDSILLPTARNIGATDVAKDQVADDDGGLKALQGTWMAYSGESGGEPIPAEQLDMKVIINDDVMNIYGGGYTEGPDHVKHPNDKLDPVAKMQLKLGEHVHPKSIDSISLDKDSTGKTGGTALGIYELSGDVLRICVSKPGGSRPTEFKTVSGSDVSLIVFKKQTGANLDLSSENPRLAELEKHIAQLEARVRALESRSK